MSKTTLNFLIAFFIIPAFLVSNQDDSLEFTRGYIYSKLEDKFGKEKISFDIQSNRIIVYEWPEDVNCEDIKLYLDNLTCYSVELDSSYEQLFNSDEQAALITNDEQQESESNFLPELNPFFPTMLAKPHIVGYSAGYRSYDKIFKISCLPVSIGDQFSLYEFNNFSYGQLYFGIEACVWAIFEGKAKSLSLINADYYIALPLTYINKNFSAKLSFFHQSSHLGDEYLLENEKIIRLNPSMEVFDLSIAYNFNNQVTTFMGYTKVMRSDDSYKIKPNGFHYGFNYYLDFFKIKFWKIEAVPYIATYFANLEDNQWRLDSSVAIGYQWDKCYGHKLRLFLEGHDGFSAEGQFSNKRTRYLAIKLLYGY